MLRRTKSSSLLPIVKLTNYFYPETTAVGNLDVDKDLTESRVLDVYPRRVGSGSLTPPPDYDQLYQAMQVESMAEHDEDRVRKKYACQGISTVDF